MKEKISIEIDSCRQCPFFKAGSSYSLDGFDRGYDWICTSKNQTIVGFVESIQEEDKIEIPKWCPKRTKDGNS